MAKYINNEIPSMRTNDYAEKLIQDRLSRIEGEIEILKKASFKQNETILGISLGIERINNTLSRIIESMDEHARRLKDIEPLSIISRHWKFIISTSFAIIIISLSLHYSLKEVIGWIF